MGSSHTIPDRKKTSVIDPLVDDWLSRMSSNRGALALAYMTGIISHFNEQGIYISEQAALEMVYKCGLFVVANGGKK